jgi:hypothetical protein
MHIRNICMNAAVAGLLAASGVAHAQLLGGGANGGFGGSIAGVGNLGATGNGALNGSLHGNTDAFGRTRDIGSRAATRVKDTAAGAKERVESTAGVAQATASGAASAAVDSASGATNAVSATAEGAGEAGTSVDLATNELSGVAAGNAAGEGTGQLDLPKRKSAVADPAAKAEPKPQPKVHTGGKASADGGFAQEDGQVSGQAGASASADAGVER